MGKPKIAERYKYFTSTEVSKKLGISRDQLRVRLRGGVFPAPTMVNEHGVRFFDENWLRIAQATQENSYEAQRKK